MVTLISEHCDIICACNFGFKRSKQISADNFDKLSEVMGFSKGAVMHLTRWINFINQCRRRQHSTNASTHCRNEYTQFFGLKCAD